MNNPEPENRWPLFALTVAVTIGILWLVASDANAQERATPDDCVLVVNNVILPVAQGRDNGVSMEYAIDVLMASGLPPTAIVAVIQFIYITYADKPVEEVGNIFLDNCIGEPT